MSNGESSNLFFAHFRHRLLEIALGLPGLACIGFWISIAFDPFWVRSSVLIPLVLIAHILMVLSLLCCVVLILKRPSLSLYYCLFANIMGTLFSVCGFVGLVGHATAVG